MTPMALLLQSVPREQLANVVAVHCTHSDMEKLEKFVTTGAGICICPLTEVALGDGVFKSLEVKQSQSQSGPCEICALTLRAWVG